MADNRTVYHCAIMQTRIPNQIEVLRWMMRDPDNFKVVWIEHYADKKPDPSIKPEQLEEDEQEHEYSDSGLVLPHIHAIIKVPKKISPHSLTGTFANYVNIRRCCSPHNYLQYLLHCSFKASMDANKHKYGYDELQTNDPAFLAQLSTPIEDSDICLRWCSYLEQSAGNIRDAMAIAIENSDFVLVREIKEHSFFYSRFFGD